MSIEYTSEYEESRRINFNVNLIKHILSIIIFIWNKNTLHWF